MLKNLVIDLKKKGVEEVKEAAVSQLCASTLHML